MGVFDWFLWPNGLRRHSSKVKIAGSIPARNNKLMHFFCGVARKDAPSDPGGCRQLDLTERPPKPGLNGMLHCCVREGLILLRDVSHIYIYTCSTTGRPFGTLFTSPAARASSSSACADSARPAVRSFKKIFINRVALDESEQSSPLCA